MLTKKDTQILKELDINSRQSNTQIAKKIGMSKETVNYTVKKLEKEGIIKGYYALINFYKLNSKIFKLLMRYQNIGEKGESKIISWLTKRKEVMWVGKTEGKWDLIITIREKNLEKIYDLLREFNILFSKNLKEKQLLISYESIGLDEKFLYEKGDQTQKIILTQNNEEIKIDNIDQQIISLIEFDARIPTIDLSSKINLTAEATAKRIKNLVSKGIITRFKLRTNLEKLGKGYHHIFISLKDFSKINEIISYYEDSKSCIFIMKYHGSYDLHLELVSESHQDFRKIIIELREKFGDLISDYQQLTILEEFI